VQNLVRAPSPNKSFWSMAIEAQLYVVFPLLLLLVRRFGGLVMVAAVTILVPTVGILGPHVTRRHTLVIQSPPDLAALFAIGIMAAGIVGATKARGGWHWPWLALAAALPVLPAISLQGSRWTLAPRHLQWVDLALGPAVACPLLGVAAGRPRPFVRLLDSRPIRSLGLSSYSLYLVHEPIVVVVYERIVRPHFHHGSTAFLVMVGIVVPVTIVFARMFAAVFEQPFLRQSGRSQLPLVSHVRLRKVAHLRSSSRGTR
jgi:peptidoglycan/LPS O-acetylase OafA/YrhL